MLKATWKSLMGRKLRLTMSALAVVLGVAFLAGSLIFTGMIKQSFDAISEGAIADINVVPAGTYDNDALVVNDQRLYLTPEQISQIRTVDGVEKATGEIASAGVFLMGKDGKVVAMAGPPSIASNYFEDPAANQRPGVVLKSGQAPTSDNEVAVDPASFDKSGHQLGDTVKIATQDGVITKKLVGTATWGSGATAGASYLFFTEKAAQDIILDGRAVYQSAWVTLAPGSNADDTIKAINAVLPADYQAYSSATAAQAISEQVGEATGFINTFLMVFVVIALVVAAFLIFNTFSILVAQRSRELALYRALGANKRQVRGTVLIEAVVTGLVGATIGIILGVLIALGVSSLMATIGLDMSAVPPIPDLSVILISYGVGVLFTLVAAIVPAQRASKVAPVAAMSGEFSAGAKELGRLIIGGAVLLVLGVAALLVGLFVTFDNSQIVVGIGALLILFGVVMTSPASGRPVIWLMGRLYRKLFGEVGKLAELNSVRQPRRTAATASALMIGLTLVTTLAILGASATKSIHQMAGESLRGDFIIQTVTFEPLSATLAEQAAEVEGVSAVREFRSIMVQGTNEALFIAAMQPENFDKMVAQTLTEGRLHTGFDEAMVSATYAKEKNLKVNDKIDTINPLTGLPEPLSVVGIFTTSSGVNAGNIVVNFETAAAFGDPKTPSLLNIDIAAGADKAAVQDRLDKLVEERPMVRVMDQEDYANAAVAQLNQILTMVYALLAFAIVIAVLGIVNTLGLAVIERTREIGLLRAVGLKRGQLRRMITLESVIIALLGAMLGVGMGLAFGAALRYVLRNDGLTLLNLPWDQLIAFLVVSVIVGMLAAIWPARRAARLNVLEAIATE